MPGKTKEPQSYGSGADWTTGNTGSTVNEQKSSPPPEHQEFYDEHREAEVNEPPMGGETSPAQLADNVQQQGRTDALDAQPVSRVTGRDGGAKRGSFFRRRDYEG